MKNENVVHFGIIGSETFGNKEAVDSNPEVYRQRADGMVPMVRDEYGLHVKEWKADSGLENGLRRPR